VIHASLGEKGRALDWLDGAYADQSEFLLFMDAYPPLAPLRGEPRFAALRRKVRGR
jgi:hypothetical protein